MNEEPVKFYKHRNGQWAKKVRGETMYFGTDLDKAADLYRAMLNPAPVLPEGEILLRDAINLWLTSCRALVNQGELSEDTWKEYRRTGRQIIQCLGETSVGALTLPVLETLRLNIGKGVSVVTANGRIKRARVFFKWLSTYHSFPMTYKAALKPPSKRAMRIATSGTRELFSPSEIQALIKAADGYMKPAVMLAINCGLGNGDIVSLMWDNISGNILDFPRPKTGVPRRAWLWNETLTCLKEWRKTIKSKYVCCGINGQPLGTRSNNTPISHRFERVIEAAGIEKLDRGFYTLRHTYRTIADGSKDLVAIDLTMGHDSGRMGDVYTHGIDAERLHDVAEAVRKWLFNQPSPRDQ